MMCYYSNDTNCGKGGVKMFEQSAAHKIRELRIEKKITIEQAATDCGVSYQSMQAYENGTRTPRDETKRKIAKYYNVPVGVLFFGEQ